MPKKKLVFLLCYCLLTLVLAGCWDRVEIEDRGFAVGSAIDLVEKKADGSYELMLTSQFVVPSGLGAPMQGRGGEQKAYLNISATGESLFQVNREMATLTSQVPFYQHLKVLIVSEDVVREPNLFGSIMDLFIRDHEMRRGIRIVIAEGEARKILDIKPDNEKIPALYLDSLMENNYKNAGSLKPVHIGELQELLLSERSYSIPEVHFADKFIQYKGAAVFYGVTNEMVDSLMGEEAKGLAFLTETSTDGSIKVNVNGEMVTVELKSVDRGIHVTPKDKTDIDAKIDIHVNGNVAERFGKASVRMDSYIKKVEKAVEDKIKKMTTQTKDKLQKELKVDVIGFGDNLYQKHYSFWNTVKDDWDKGENYYSQSKINIDVTAKVQMVGSSDKVKTTGDK
ncbi:MAG: Ger(x)C family spore germination protein [Bacillota bacterium]